jgi:hypothetical protein
VTLVCTQRVCGHGQLGTQSVCSRLLQAYELAKVHSLKTLDVAFGEKVGKGQYESIHFTSSCKVMIPRGTFAMGSRWRRAQARSRSVAARPLGREV